MQSSRLGWLVIFFLIFAVVIAGRLVYLSVIAAPYYSEKAQESRTMYIDMSPRRGTIYDKNGTILATNIDATTIYCNPYEVTDPSGTAAQLVVYLGGEKDQYEKALRTENTSFAYVYRKADEEVANNLKDLDIPGIYFLSDTKRVYPCGQTGGQIVGMCDVDGNGLSGLELYYDDILAGTPGSLVAERGAGGYPIVGGVHEESPAVNGQDIVISIDVGMQEYLESRLTECMKQLGGKNGNAVLYDAESGDIVAIASLPLLNPGDRDHIEAGATELRSISYPFEPGSIFKTVSATAILEAGVLTPDNALYCPAYLKADEYTVSDAHERADTTYTFREILQYSSNVGISLATKKLGFGPLYDKIVEYNLTDYTGIDYPGESMGYCTDESEWSTIQSYNISFGQGISVTPLQMTRFYGALVNDGVECRPHFLLSNATTGEKPAYETETVIQNKDAIPTVTSMLQTVVSDGTGTGAQIDGFAPAGKTGTAEYVGESGTYLAGMNNISFIGFLPNTNSKLVCFVGVGEVAGDNVTTPAFKDIMSFAIDRYRIAAS